MEWPYGAATAIGVIRPNSVDSPLMAAIANTGIGRWMSDNHLQVYGWINGGFNISSNSIKPGGNAPVAYAYTPNIVQLDQAVVYLERLPDTVQTEHIDWGANPYRIHMPLGARVGTATDLDRLVLLRREQDQAGAIILAFRPRPPLTQRIVPDSRAEQDLPEALSVSGSLVARNRPLMVFREIIWAMAIPLGTVLLFRVVVALFFIL